MAKATIVNFVPLPINEFKPGLYPGHYQIEAADGDKPGILVIGEAKKYIYLDENRGSHEATVTVEEIADSLCKDYIDGHLAKDEGAAPALFWVPNEHTLVSLKMEYGKLIAEKLAAQKQWFMNLTKLADTDYARAQRNPAVISDLQRFAAKQLGLKKEWMVDPEIVGNINCPACTTLISKEAIVCPTCRCIVNHEKYAGLQFAAPMPFMSGIGGPTITPSVGVTTKK